jgi:Asp-tRNA(Asn)/Glu-tRNA(Gln) amidotransferase A subunit family amidase
MDVEELSVEWVHSAFLRGELDSAELCSSYLELIDEFEGGVHPLGAIRTINESALGDAARLDRALRRTGELSGPLHGVPIVIKDSVDTAGIPTSYGSITAAANVPTHDARVVRRLRQAGAIILAKATMADFGMSWFSNSSISDLTHNPYNYDHDSGGSSCGTGAAVSANLALAGIGGDTGGSVRVPASFCNLVGIRVSPERVSLEGVAPLLSVQDTLGPMTRTLSYAAAVLDGLGASLPGEGSFVDSLHQACGEPVTFGVVRQLVGYSAAEDESTDVTGVFDRALGELRTAGCKTVDLTIPGLPGLLRDSSLYLLSSRDEVDAFIKASPGIAADSLQDIYQSRQYPPSLDLLEEIATGTIARGAKPAIQAAGRARAQLRDAVLSLMIDTAATVLCFPTVRLPPPTHQDIRRGRWPCLEYPTNTVVASQAGLPAATVPAGFTPSGLPVGLELVAPAFGEHRLLSVAQRVEQVLGARRPPPN